LEARELVGLLNESALNLLGLVNGILDYSKNTSISYEKFENIDFLQLMNQVLNTISVPEFFEIKFEKNNINNIVAPRIPLMQIMMNLISNAIKYNDKDHGILNIEVTESDDFYNFKLSDNGPGIAQENHEKIFKMLRTLGTKDRFNQKGTGIGLATVKRLIEKLGGEIQVISELGLGATFDFRIKRVHLQ
jgi:signal transduction histidine kinase